MFNRSCQALQASDGGSVTFRNLRDPRSLLFLKGARLNLVPFEPGPIFSLVPDFPRGESRRAGTDGENLEQYDGLAGRRNPV
jgi:hypothetical protein